MPDAELRALSALQERRQVVRATFSINAISWREVTQMNLDFSRAFVIVGLVSAVAGWALIEGAIWIGSHISIGWLA